MEINGIFVPIESVVRIEGNYVYTKDALKISATNEEIAELNKLIMFNK